MLCIIWLGWIERVIGDHLLGFHRAPGLELLSLPGWNRASDLVLDLSDSVLFTDKNVLLGKGVVKSLATL